MVHATTGIQVGETTWLQVGYTMCFTEPTVTMHRVRKAPEHSMETEATLSFDAAHLDAVIAALQKVRDALPAARL
jgi:hypothetical protein